MKIGEITQLLKKAGLDAADDSNFRPITNLSTMSKLLERLALASSASFSQLLYPSICL